MGTKKLLLASAVVFCLSAVGASAQSTHTFLDVYGNELPTPSWPPPDSAYEPGAVIIWLSDSVIDREYIADWLDNLVTHDPMTACHSNFGDIITDSALASSLNSLGLIRLCPITFTHPINHTVSHSRCGDSFPTPHFWNLFRGDLDNPSKTIEVIDTLAIRFGGNGIDYVEPVPVVKLSGEPNDPGYVGVPPNFIKQDNLTDSLYGVNCVKAWDRSPRAHGTPNVRVAVIDGGIKYTHHDFGGDPPNYNVGGNNRIKGGLDYPDFGPGVMLTDGGDHGTKVAGIIAAAVDNTLGVAGIAGGSNSSEGVSVYSMKVPDFNNVLNFDKVMRAYYDAVSDTLIGGFQVNVTNHSYDAGSYYSESAQRFLDYAYHLCAITVSAKTNANGKAYNMLADLENNKVIAVGGADLDTTRAEDSLPPIVPVKANWSGYGYGIDMMAPDYAVENRWGHVQSLTDFLPDPTSFGPVGNYNSWSAPHVSGAAALIISEYDLEDSTTHENIDRPLAPEDVEGLLSITALDMKYRGLNHTVPDTLGFDERTGYGLIKIDSALWAMQYPHELRHYSDTGGVIVDSVFVDDFWLIEPLMGRNNTLPASNSSNGTVFYSAMRYKVRKTISISGWDTARSWGIGGFGTRGWNAAMPKRLDSNEFTQTQAGYCRVLGEDAPNADSNMRDISWRNDSLTLETYVYRVTQKFNVDKGWWPCVPDSVIYRYAIWGVNPQLEVPSSEHDFERTEIAVRVESSNADGGERISVRYTMNRPGPAAIVLYDALGRSIEKLTRESRNANEHTVSFLTGNLGSGIYYVSVRGTSGEGKAKVVLVR